jgi:phage protein
MNKQELIKHFKELPYVSISQMGQKSFIDLIEQLDEPQKPVIPKFMADFIERERRSGGDLEDLFIDIVYEQYHLEWFREEKNMNLVARAWLDGYTVEEKRYLVSLRNGQPLVKTPLGKDFYFNQNILAEKYKTTRKELEQAGFGWVFDCPGVEVKEVK